MYLVCTIKYSEEETNEKNQLVLVRKEHNLLVECCNYTEAEAEATKVGEEISEHGEFSIHPIKEMKVSAVHPYEGRDDLPYFKCDAVYYAELDEKRKAFKRSILVQEKSSESASKKALSLMQNWADTMDCEVPKVTQTNVNEVIVDDND